MASAMRVTAATCGSESRPCSTPFAPNRARPVAEIIEQVFGTLRAHTGDVAPRDDLTLIVLRS